MDLTIKCPNFRFLIHLLKAMAKNVKSASTQTCDDYITNVIGYDYLPHARLPLRINKITMYSIAITIATTFVLKHSQNENKTNLRVFT